MLTSSKIITIKSKSTFLLLVIILITCFSCEKEKQVISNVPEIKFISVNPSIAMEYKDSLVFTISYKDGDGDLGENNTSNSNVFLIDNRTKVNYGFRIPQLSPSGSSIAIKGNLSITLKNTGITDGSNQQIANYSIYIKDRSENLSNIIVSSDITIKK